MGDLGGFILRHDAPSCRSGAVAASGMDQELRSISTFSPKPGRVLATRSPRVLPPVVSHCKTWARNANDVSLYRRRIARPTSTSPDPKDRGDPSGADPTGPS